MGMLERLTAHLQTRFPMSPPKVCLLCAIWCLSSILGLGANLEYASGRVYPMAWCLGLAGSGDVKSGPFSFVKTRIFDMIIPNYRGADTSSAKGIIKDIKDNKYKRTHGSTNIIEFQHVASAPDEFTGILEELPMDYMAGYEEAMTRLKDFQMQSRQLGSEARQEIPKCFYTFASVAVRDPFLELVQPKNFYKGWLARMYIAIDTSKGYAPRVAVDPLLDAETDAIVAELKQWWNDYGHNETILKLDHQTSMAVNARGTKLFKRSRKSTASSGAVLLRAEENLLILLQIYWMSEQFVNPMPPCYYSTSDMITMKLFKPVCKVADIFLHDTLLVCSLIEGDDDVKRVRRILASSRRWVAHQELLHRFSFGKDRLNVALQIIGENGELDKETKKPKRGPSGNYYRMRKVRK